MIELREIIARILFQDRYRLRTWESMKDFSPIKKQCYEKADEAIRRAGLKNMKLRVQVCLTENVR